MMIRIPVGLLTLAIVLLAGLQFSATASIRPPDDKSSNLLLISATDASRDRLRGLELVLKQHYGVVAVDRAIGGTSQVIEARIFDAMRALRTHDVLIVVVDLPLHRAKTYERVLKTSDFDPARPWTGFPILALQKLASVSSEGTMVLVFPDCPTLEQVPAQTVIQNAQISMRGFGESSRTLISYCSAESDDADSLYGALSEVLEDAAGAPVSRAPWQGRLEKGLVSLSDIARGLRERTRRLGLSIDLSAGGGWLRVFSRGTSDQLPVADTDVQPEAVAGALRDLHDTSPETQVKAIYTLTSHKITSAYGDFVRLLSQSQDNNVRMAAARGLGSLPDDEVGVVALISAMDDTDADVRLEALAALGRTGSGPATREALQRGLRDPEARVREAALYGLGQHWADMAPQDTLAVAADALRLLREDHSEGVRAAAIWTLAKGRQLDTLPDLTRLAATEDATRVRLAALDGLAEIGDSRAVATLVPVAHEAATTSDGLRIRLAAVRALGKLDTPESVDALLALAADPISAVGTAATAGLAQLKSASALALDLAVTDAMPREQRLLAIQTLGRNDSGAAARVLFDLLRSQDAAVRSRSAAALRGQNDPAVLDRLNSLLLSPAEGVAQRVLAAEALSGRPSPNVVTTLVKATADRNDEVRAAAATALASSAPGHAHVKTLLRLSKDESPLVREAVLDALGQYGGQNAQVRKALETIVQTDPDPALSSFATQTLRDLQLNSSAQVSAATSPEVDLGPFRRDQRKWRVDVFWCEGTSAQRLKDRAMAYATNLQKFAESIRNEDQVIASISLRSISEKTNALPGYQVTQDELRYESGDPLERRWAERLRIGLGEKFVPRPVRTPTPGYLSLFVCALTAASDEH